MEDERREDGEAQAVAKPVPSEEADGDDDVSAIREWLELIGRAAFWALFLYLFVFQVSVVEGPSMQPNFQTSDRLVIDKLTYKFVPISRFDVIVFQAVEVDMYHQSRESKDYIKRVIGMPGDRVSFKDSGVYVNGKLLKEPFAYDRPRQYFCVTSEYVVPPKHYFVMGDNRENSKDSRSSSLGFVPESQVRGIARLRFMPLSRRHWISRY